MNDTMGETFLVHSRLVFGVLFRFSILSTNPLYQKKLMEAIKTAQAEMNSIVAERKVYESLTRNTPPVADRAYKLGKDGIGIFRREKMARSLHSLEYRKLNDNNTKQGWYLSPNIQCIPDETILPDI